MKALCLAGSPGDRQARRSAHNRSAKVPALPGKARLVNPDQAYTHHANPDVPQYEVKSAKTDHIAFHKGSALTKLRD